MGAWKEDVDEESERLDRQKAAFGADSIGRIKDLNILILGLGPFSTHVGSDVGREDPTKSSDHQFFFVLNTDQRRINFFTFIST